MLGTRVDQRVSERLARRGFVHLDTLGSSIPVGLVRHPGALCRLIDAERLRSDDSTFPLDTVFTYDDPTATNSRCDLTNGSGVATNERRGISGTVTPWQTDTVAPRAAI